MGAHTAGAGVAVKVDVQLRPRYAFKGGPGAHRMDLNAYLAPTAWMELWKLSENFRKSFKLVSGKS